MLNYVKLLLLLLHRIAVSDEIPFVSMPCCVLPDQVSNRSVPAINYPVII